MKCPYCGSLENKESKREELNEHTVIRRVRLCCKCERTFVTLEFCNAIHRKVEK